MTNPPFKEPTNLKELIDQICLRPTMLVGSYKFDLAMAFINGFVYSASKFQPEKYSQTELKDFSSWLAEKFDYPRNYAWMHLQSIFTDDEVAFIELPKLYEEFRKLRE